MGNISEKGRIMRSLARKHRGFTLIELMITLIVVAVLLTMGVPSMASYFDRQKIKAAGEQLYADLQLARSEAIARNTPIRIHVAANGSATWAYGVSNVDNCDLSVTDPTDATACTLVVDDGDLSVHGIEGAVDTDDKVLQRYTSAEHQDIALSRTGFLNGNQITFDPSNGTAIGNSGNLLLTSPNGRHLLVKVNPLGLVRICSPDSSVNGYPNGAPADNSDC